MADHFTGYQLIQPAFCADVNYHRSTLMPITPTSTGIADDTASDEEDALAQLDKLVERMRAAQPQLTKSQAFDRVYSNPANAALAMRERLQNRPQQRML